MLSSDSPASLEYSQALTGTRTSKGSVGSGEQESRRDALRLEYGRLTEVWGEMIGSLLAAPPGSY
jgi:hypothetical protein